jgi:hypothetical protein
MKKRKPTAIPIIDPTTPVGGHLWDLLWDQLGITPRRMHNDLWNSLKMKLKIAGGQAFIDGILTRAIRDGQGQTIYTNMIQDSTVSYYKIKNNS